MQHLLGIGHLVRGARVARAAAAAGFDVTIVVGGELPAGIDFGAVALARLPPVKAGPAGFSELVTPDGLPFDEARRADRRDRLLGLFAVVSPDILLIEAFPFGRRPMRFELLPLLDAARALAEPPLIVCSVRDILQRSRKPGRDREAVNLVKRFFDHVIVHGDPVFCPLGTSFPLAADLADRIVYGGLVGPPVEDEALISERFDVIVSVGGGAVGAELVATALAARPLSALADVSWLVLTGPNGGRADDAAPVPGVTLRAFAPDLPARLRQARLSISQAGYNTVTDLLAAPACRAVLVPFVAGGESEQAERAAIMAERGWAVQVEAAGLSPSGLAQAVDRALALPQGTGRPSIDGAAGTARHLLAALSGRRNSLDGHRRHDPPLHPGAS